MRKRLLYLGVALLMMWIATALGEAGLTARLEGSTLSVRWKEIGAGEGVLTVYRDDWPVSVMNVLGASGGIDIYVGDSAGRYSVRLRTDGGCLSAKAEQPLTGPERSEAPVPDRTVIPEATAVPAPDEVPEPDATDNAAPTAASTVEPARTPLPTSTAAPTAIITSQPTPTPSPIATPRPTATAMAAGSERSDLAAQVVDQVNRERAAQGLSALRSDTELTRAACVRAREIAVKFSHTRPNGTSWSTVSADAYGENIAMGQRTADKVMAAWMTSEGHRANIMRASYGSIGVCCLTLDGVTYWVQLFGK